ncbi:S-layer homology domain-containing protein [Paenibacillus sp. SYP-B4298]|uniref:S-layer homology domain-containing protein n=1 Tax=Paenibacillus sp. SYP-B4298 TaxID=2996034 RepID=UPI0022DD6CD1|nr:S-layer homology domain-containing protein [Paenibacillus sp. SYP-B4298]
MRNKWMNGLSLLLLWFASIPFSAAVSAEAPRVPIKDIQTHYWSTAAQSKLQPKQDSDMWNEEDSKFGLRSYPGLRYFLSELTVSAPANFLLYENGELWFSTDVNFSENSFSKIMSNVKSISQITVPFYKSRELVETKISNNQFSQYEPRVDSEQIETVQLSTILTNDGALYIMGGPSEIPLTNRNLTIENSDIESRQYSGNSLYNRDILTTISIDMIFPFSYQASPNTFIKIADNIDYIDPYYYYSETLHHGIGASRESQEETGEKGFFIDKSGKAYLGFPGQTSSNTLANQNLVNYIPYDKIMLLEDGTLYRDNTKVSHNIKDFTSKLYLLNDGTLYDYEHHLVDRDVKAIYKSLYHADGELYLYDYDYYIKSDDSLWGGDWTGYSKLMDDVAGIFQVYAVRTNGDAYAIEESANGSLLPKKIMNGNGLTPAPAAKVHAGRIFKDASNWALVDLRSARTSGLTLPVQDLSYNQAITREKFCEITVKLYEQLAQKSAPLSSKNTFEDTNNPEILKAYELGIVKGTSETMFSPQAKITREEVATMLKRTVDKAGKSLQQGSAKKFSDQAQISSWARDAVSAMSAANIVKGLSEATFAPKQNTTIEQAVIMANRLVK